MDELNLQNNNLNPRLYIYSKYAFSAGYFLLMLALFLVYLSSYKDLIPVNNLIITDVVILVLSLSLFAFFTIFRINLHKKSEYKLNNKDKKWYVVVILLVIITIAIVIVWIAIIKNIDQTSFLVWWIISLVLVVVLSFSASVIEYLARFNEFSKIASAFEIKAQENDAIITQQYLAKNQTAENIFNENIKETEEKEEEEND
ncbi:hypothetical protein [Spiroplasma endosymbiont of Othius punctulatus]|uniref:hypothetical protein n=1 Tax=Spiroplasma endosymbiont of Othius punctulatus TaxID=3066289 RepID=UPI0030CD0080